MNAVTDVMVAALAAFVVDDDVVGVGLGTPLAVASALLARATTARGAHLLVGGVVDPDADLATCLAGPAALAGRTAGYVPHLDTMDMAERQAMTLQFLRPAQVDGHGNLNTSRIGPRRRPSVRFPGGLATGDVPTLLPRIVAFLPRHELRALPERVACVTGAGGGWHGDAHPTRGVVAVVTDLAVLCVGADGARLASIHPGVAAQDVVARTGFDLEIATDVPVTPGPDPAQQAALQRLDPSGLRAGVDG